MENRIIDLQDDVLRELAPVEVISMQLANLMANRETSQPGKPVEINYHELFTICSALDTAIGNIKRVTGDKAN